MLSKFERLLDVYRNGDSYNFVSMQGGCYFIPESLKDKFWRYYIRDIDAGKQHGLIYSLPHRDHLPVTFDMDIIHAERTIISDERLESLVFLLTQCVMQRTHVDKLRVFGLRKPDPTPKRQQWKNGAHVIFHGIKVSRDIARDIRRAFLEDEHVREFLVEFDVTSMADMLDDSVSPPVSYTHLTLPTNREV